MVKFLVFMFSPYFLYTIYSNGGLRSGIIAKLRVALFLGEILAKGVGSDLLQILFWWEFHFFSLVVRLRISPEDSNHVLQIDYK